MKKNIIFAAVCFSLSSLASANGGCGEVLSIEPSSGTGQYISPQTVMTLNKLKASSQLNPSEILTALSIFVPGASLVASAGASIAGSAAYDEIVESGNPALSQIEIDSLVTTRIRIKPHFGEEYSISYQGLPKSIKVGDTIALGGWFITRYKDEIKISNEKVMGVFGTFPKNLPKKIDQRYIELCYTGYMPKMLRDINGGKSSFTQYQIAYIDGKFQKVDMPEDVQKFLDEQDSK